MGVLDDLKTQLGLGARSNKYRVSLAAPSVSESNDNIINTLCKGGSIPAKTMGSIEIFTQGRKMFLVGDAQYEGTWTLTFWNTQDHNLRNKFDDWFLFMDNMETHTRGTVDGGNHDYMTQGAKVEQLNTSGGDDATATYKFFNMFPTQISSVELADETADTISEFTVDFAYSHWVKE